VKAEIISVGTELLLGEITDTNANFLAGQLPPLGIDLYWISQVGDNQARLVEVLRRAWQRSDLILTTGGLGPTGDDLTREAIAEMLVEKMEVAPILADKLRQFFARRNVEMPASNLKQATIIPSATPIYNSQGTAPGWWVEREGHLLIAMPGPPREMQKMWDDDILPQLGLRCSGEIIFSKTLKTFGLGEAKVGELVTPLLSLANPTLGVYAKLDGIHLRLTAKAQSQQQAEEMIAQSEANVRSILGEYIWGADNDRLEALVGNLLAEKELSLATMESCTGGLLASAVTDVSGSSAYFKGGLVAYSNEAKIAYGVAPKLISDFGAVSPEVVQAMAAAARLYFEADIGVSTTGVVGPSEIEGKPVGTVYIGIDWAKSKKVVASNYPGNRIWVKHRVTGAALVELTKILIALD